MAQATGFRVDLTTGDITMNAGDTGSFWVHAARKSGEAWTADDRMLFTVKNGQGEIVLQRFYMLDDQWGQGDGFVLIEFHNDDTDTWADGQYSMERRYDISPRWSNGAPEGRCVNALTAGTRMIEGDIVRTVTQGTLKIDRIYGEV